MRRENSGVSLTEIVVAVIFLSLALLPLIGLLVLSHEGTSATLYQTKAFLLADDVVEAVGALGFEEIDASLPAEIAAKMPVPKLFTRTVTVDPNQDVSDTIDKKGKFRIKTVRVEVVWEGQTPVERRTIKLVALSTKVER